MFSSEASVDVHRNKKTEGVGSELHGGSSLGLLFVPEDGPSMFL
jgi:hypothetical protein